MVVEEGREALRHFVEEARLIYPAFVCVPNNAVATVTR
jgi:hypothetical protein